MIHIRFAEGLAARAIYLTHRGAQRNSAYIGIDPTHNSGPQVFGGYAIGSRWCEFRRTVPHLRYRVNAGRIYRAAYRLQNRILIALDGRG